MSPDRRRFPVPEQGSKFKAQRVQVDGVEVNVISQEKPKPHRSLQPINLYPVMERHFEGLDTDPDYVAGNIDSAELLPVVRAYRNEGVSVVDLIEAGANIARQRGFDEDRAIVAGTSFATGMFEFGKTQGITLVQSHRGTPKSSSLNSELSDRRATPQPRRERS